MCAGIRGNCPALKVWDIYIIYERLEDEIKISDIYDQLLFYGQFSWKIMSIMDRSDFKRNVIEMYWFKPACKKVIPKLVQIYLEGYRINFANSQFPLSRPKIIQNEFIKKDGNFYEIINGNRPGKFINILHFM